MREAVASGTFYPEDKKELLKEIEDSFTHPLGPGMPEKKRSGHVFGVISPHAGFAYSGPAAAHSYKALAEAKAPDTYIILGTNHTGLGSSSICMEDFNTPLGTAKLDKEFASSILRHGNLSDSKLSHMQEHSIEVQLPFLQYIEKNPKIIPITISHELPLDEFAHALKLASKEMKRSFTMIASSDFTHYGPSYGYVPFTKDIKHSLYDLDRLAIKHITNLDMSSLQKHFLRYRSTICGIAPILGLMHSCKAFGIKKGSLLQYYTSGDITKDYTNAVGYASVVFK